jgi:hypothetical protein
MLASMESINEVSPPAPAALRRSNPIYSVCAHLNGCDGVVFCAHTIKRLSDGALIDVVDIGNVSAFMDRQQTVALRDALAAFLREPEVEQNVTV